MATASAPAAGASSKAAGTKSTAKTVTKSAAGTTTTKKKPTKKKSTSTKKTDSAKAYADARQAQLDLADQWNNAARKATDSLWCLAEDVLPSVTNETAMVDNSNKILPEEIKIVDGALKKNGMSRSDVTPQAFACLLEQARRFAVEILTDSQDYASLAGRTEIAKADLTLANEMRPDHPISITTQLPKLNLLAQTVNRVPLPPIPTQCYSGVLLPPKHHQLTARTFDVVTGAQTAQRMVQAAPTQPLAAKPSSKPSSKSAKGSGGEVAKPGYGAARGRQISINLKDKGGDKSKGAATKTPAGSGGGSGRTATTGNASAGTSSGSTTAMAAAPAPATSGAAVTTGNSIASAASSATSDTKDGKKETGASGDDGGP